MKIDAAQVVKGIVEGCRQSGCALLGGEARPYLTYNLKLNNTFSCRHNLTSVFGSLEYPQAESGQTTENNHLKTINTWSNIIYHTGWIAPEQCPRLCRWLKFYLPVFHMSWCPAADSGDARILPGWGIRRRRLCRRSREARCRHRWRPHQVCPWGLGLGFACLFQEGGL